MNNKRGREFNCVSKKRDVEERWCRRVVVLFGGLVCLVWLWVLDVVCWCVCGR